MVIEALKAARDFIESDRQDLAESLTVKGEIVFEDDIDRGAMAEYVKVLAVIDGAIEQALAARPAPVQGPVGYTDGDGRAWAVKWSGALPPNLTLFATPPAPVPLTDDQINTIRFSIQTKAVTQRDFELARAIEAAHGITKGQS